MKRAASDPPTRQVPKGPVQWKPLPVPAKARPKTRPRRDDDTPPFKARPPQARARVPDDLEMQTELDRIMQTELYHIIDENPRQRRQPGDNAGLPVHRRDDARMPHDNAGLHDVRRDDDAHLPDVRLGHRPGDDAHLHDVRLGHRPDDGRKRARLPVPAHRLGDDARHPVRLPDTMVVPTSDGDGAKATVVGADV